MPLFQKYLRKYQISKNIVTKKIYKVMFAILKRFNHIEIDANTQIGEGLYIGHPYGITINPKAVIGRNVNIHKGVTIGQENRGDREGTPIIGEDVWIGINSTIVGKIIVGNHVLIAPNTYVNCNIPDYSVVFGNPCIIKHKEDATKNYVNNKV